jgi:hypothetical protein
MKQYERLVGHRVERDTVQSIAEMRCCNSYKTTKWQSRNGVVSMYREHIL